MLRVAANIVGIICDIYVLCEFLLRGVTYTRYHCGCKITCVEASFGKGEKRVVQII